MKIIYSVITLLCCPTFLCATPQAGDSLVLEDGHKKWVHNFVLSKTAENSLDRWKRQKSYEGTVSSANWDGFYARLILKEGKLYITSVAVDAHSEKKGFFRAEVPTTAIFGSKPPVFAAWFSGDLHEYYGETRGYTEVKSNVRIYRFKKGILTKVEDREIGKRK